MNLRALKRLRKSGIRRRVAKETRAGDFRQCWWIFPSFKVLPTRCVEVIEATFYFCSGGDASSFLRISIDEYKGTIVPNPRAGRDVLSRDFTAPFRICST
jgi:hypothetical protein